ncbi:unnamed protein product [Boreogadus saida]
MVPESDDEGEKKSVKKKRKRKKSSARKASDGSAAESDAESKKKKKIKEEGQALVDFSIKVCQAKESGEFRPANTIIDRALDAAAARIQQLEETVKELTIAVTAEASKSVNVRKRDFGYIDRGCRDSELPVLHRRFTRVMSD